MKFITVRDLRTSPAQIWKQLPEEQELVITNNGKPIALLTPLSDESLEDSLKSIRTARAANAIRSMQNISQKFGNDTLNEDEILNEILATRTEKK